MTRRPLGSQPASAVRLVWIGVLAAAVYVGISFLLFNPGPWEVAPAYIFYPPSGIIFGLLYLYGRRLWPAAAIGAAIVTIATGGGFAHVLATAAGNSLEAVLALVILERFAFDRMRGAVRDVGVLCLATIAGAALSATFGVAGLGLTTEIGGAGLARIWAMWTMGHGLGLLLFGTPFIMFRRDEPPALASRVRESLAMVVGLVVVAQLAFSAVPGSRGSYPLQYLTYPFLIWAALRSTWFWVAIANMITSGSALVWTAIGVGPFHQGEVAVSLFYGSIFSVATWLTTMILTASMYSRRRSEASRRSQESAYHAVVEQAVEAIFVLDASGICTEVNAAGARLFGHEPDDLIGQPLSRCLPGEQRAALEQLIRGLEPGSEELVEWEIGDPSAPQSIEASVKRFDDGAMQVFARDVSERKSLERQISHSQKMEAVGLLAGGVAHDFNNQLTVILGQASLGLELVPEAAASFREIVRAADKSAELTEQLLTFARRRPGSPEVVDVEELLQANVDVFRRVLGERIRYVREEWHSSSGPLTVSIDRTNLEQVILNLVLNAKDAMPGGGRLTISAGADQGGSGVSGKGDMVTIRVQDTGVGMDIETVNRVFEPFFTTKAGLSRTGLGLSVSYGIIRDADGDIRCESTAGVGTTFQVLLPRAVGAPKSRGDTARSARRGAGERILIIEDDHSVRRYVEVALTRLGYRVVGVADGRSAVDRAARDEHAFDLILCDVILPDLPGPEVVRQLLNGDESIPVLFMSGYEQDQLAVAGDVPPQILRKPFALLSLSEAVAGALGAGASALVP